MRCPGSDLKEGLIVERLRAEGVEVLIGHSPANLGEADLVAISSAIPEHNPELRAARESGLGVLRRSDLLPAVSAQKRTIAVGGTHGKDHHRFDAGDGSDRSRPRAVVHHRRRRQRDRLGCGLGRR